MSEMLFTEDHEWFRLIDDDVGEVGITDYAQDQLGELVFIELPEVGAEVQRGQEIAVIESVKAAGELNAPVTGTVVAVNESLTESPDLVNQDPVGEGWFVKLRPSNPGELAELMDETSYLAYVDGLEG